MADLFRGGRGFGGGHPFGGGFGGGHPFGGGFGGGHGTYRSVFRIFLICFRRRIQFPLWIELELQLTSTVFCLYISVRKVNRINSLSVFRRHTGFPRELLFQMDPLESSTLLNDPMVPPIRQLLTPVGTNCGESMNPPTFVNLEEYTSFYRFNIHQF